MRWTILVAIAVVTTGCENPSGDTVATHDATTSALPSGKEDSTDGLPQEDIDTNPDLDGSDGSVGIDGTGDDGAMDGVVADGSDVVPGAGCANFPPSGEYRDMEYQFQSLHLSTESVNGKCSGTIQADVFPYLTFTEAEALPLGADQKLMFGESVIIDCQTPDHGELSIRVVDTEGNVDSENFFVRIEE